VLSILSSYFAAVVIAFTIAAGVPLWDLYVPAETNVEDVLWSRRPGSSELP
jgi:hypothetical protein